MKSRRKNQKAIVAFSLALVMSLSATGTLVGISNVDSICVNAEVSDSSEGIVLPKNLFCLTDDNLVNTYKVVTIPTKGAFSFYQTNEGFNANSSASITLSKPYDSENALQMNVLERKRRANGVDYFKVTDNKLTFLNYNPLMSENKTKLFDASKDTSLVISANQDAFTLQTYTAPTGDEISDTVTVYYTSKGRNGQATAIAKIDAFSPELEILYSKNYEYYAIVNNESPNPQANGTTKHYRWNPETKQWEHFLSTGAKAQTTVPLYVTKQYFPMLVSSEFTYRYDANHNADTRIVNYQLNNNIKIYCDMIT